MAIRRIQPIQSRDPEYSRSFPGREQQNNQPAAVEAQVSVRHLPTEGLNSSPTAVETAKVEPVQIEPQASQPAPAEPPAPAARRVRAPTPQKLPVPPKRGRAGETRTTRFSVWVRPLLEQVDRIDATGLPPQRVLKAAWQRAAARYTLGPSYIEPAATDRSEGREYGFSTTLRLDADALSTLLHEHDPLRITPYWSLIRGQVEPLFWQALDEVLAELDKVTRAKRGTTAP